MTSAGIRDPTTSSSFALEPPEKDGATRAYSLQIVSASGLRSIPITSGRVLRIGRSPDCDVVIDHPAASRQHAAIYGGDPPEIEDLHSEAGTRVQSTRIAPGRRILLSAGNMIQIADTLLNVRQQGAAAPTAHAITPKDRPGPGVLRQRAALVRDAKMLEVYRLAERVAGSGIAVLVLGETGAGKQLVAERIHAASRRRDRPFSRINCAALAEGVLSSELFGHERGAFTGAHATKIGIFEAAHTGTVFLDEIGELSLEAQAKLLRVLETGEVIRVGSHLTRQVDVRVISATHRDLPRLVGEGRFRADLFFRLNGVSLVVPPLRERPLDIVPLAEFFARSCAASMGSMPPQLAEDAKATLLCYPWPGNVRELKNAIERAIVLSSGPTIDASSIQFDFAPAPALAGATPTDDPPPPREATRFQAARRAEELRAALRSAERERIVEALDHAGNQVAAARLLGLSRRALIYRLDLYQIRRPRKGRPPRTNRLPCAEGAAEPPAPKTRPNEPFARRAGADDMPWILARYEEAGIAHSDLARGLIALIESNGAPAAVGHLTGLGEGDAELGGPFVFDELCEREIAKKIVGFLLDCRQGYARIFCLCFIHHSNLYEECGFRSWNDLAAIPEPIVRRQEQCNERYRQPTVLLSLSPPSPLRLPRDPRTAEH